MSKRITDSQVLGELGETAVKKIVLEMQFIYDPRGRLEAGTDGIIELRDPKTGAPLGKFLDDRFHESCHNGGIHLDSWTPT